MRDGVIYMCLMIASISEEDVYGTGVLAKRFFVTDECAASAEFVWKWLLR
jgi:hypothetical protein